MDPLMKVAPAADDSGQQAKLSLKEIRTALGDGYKPIITVEEAAALSRLAVKTIQKKVSDPSRWTAYRAKRISLPWQERVILSARMLTRISGNNPYGLRTAEQGLSLTIAQDDCGRPYVILRTADGRTGVAVTLAIYIRTGLALS